MNNNVNKSNNIIISVCQSVPLSLPLRAKVWVSLVIAPALPFPPSAVFGTYTYLLPPTRS